MKKTRFLSAVLLLVFALCLLVPAYAARKETKIEITVALPDVGHDITIKVYVDGELDRSKTDTVDPCVGTKTYTFVGTHGTKEVRIKLDGKVCYEYELDFDTGTYTLLSQSDYPDSMLQRSTAWVKTQVDKIFD